MRTDFDTLRELAHFTINFLTEEKFVEYHVENRLEIVERLATEYGVSLATDEDIKDQAIEEVEEKLGQGNLPEDVTESEMYNHARKEIIKSFNGETISGLYLVESLHKTSHRVKNFLLDCDLVEDVFGTDEDILDLLIKRVRQFSSKRTATAQP